MIRKKTTNQYAEDKRLVSSFDLKKDIFQILVCCFCFVFFREDDFWIGIFDSDISDERLSDSGYAWSTSCAPLSTSWTNWKSGEPQNTADSFCIAMFKDSPRWRSAKCNEERPFLCRQELEGRRILLQKLNFVLSVCWWWWWWWWWW